MASILLFPIALAVTTNGAPWITAYLPAVQLASSASQTSRSTPRASIVVSYTKNIPKNLLFKVSNNQKETHPLILASYIKNQSHEIALSLEVRYVRALEPHSKDQKHKIKFHQKHHIDKDTAAQKTGVILAATPAIRRYQGWSAACLGTS